MAVKIGHASLDENKNIKGGAAGDQSGTEVRTLNWYSKPWHTVFRPKDSTIAEKIAKAMEQACANNKIGYDQSQRTALYTQAKALNWDISQITTACECDCSSLVAVCVNAAGIEVSKDMYTGNEKSVLDATGAFTLFTESKYVSKADYLKRGDILLGNGHTAVALSNGSYAEPNATPTVPESTVSITLYVLKNGSVNEQVRTLQRLLIANGYKMPKYGADGDFGAETENAVKKFQTANSLTADGIVGNDTWNKLLKG